MDLNFISIRAEYRKQIEKIVFDGNKSIQKDTYIELQGNTLYIHGKDILYLERNDTVSLTFPFKNFQNLRTVQFGEFVDFSKIEKMDCLFEGCENLEHVDFGPAIHTAHPTTMARMFKECFSLKFFDFPEMDYSRLTSLRGCFSRCSALRSVNTTNLKNGCELSNISYLFLRCSRLTNVNLDGIQWGKIKFMEETFSSCLKLPSIDLSGCNFNLISNVAGCFLNCFKLKEVNIVATGEIHNIEHIYDLFRGCSAIKKIDLGFLQPSEKCTQFSDMFRECANLKEIQNMAPDFFKHAESTEYCFFMCSKLKNLKLKIQNLSLATGMFYDCSSLTSLDLSEVNLQNILNADKMFTNCSSLTTIPLPKYKKLPAIENELEMEWMFSGCKKLKYMSLEFARDRKICSLNHVFRDCESLVFVDLNMVDMKDMQTMDNTFDGCVSLKYINSCNLPKTGTVRLIDAFCNCHSLKSLNLKMFSINTASSNIFKGCDSLLSVYVHTKECKSIVFRQIPDVIIRVLN